MSGPIPMLAFVAVMITIAATGPKGNAMAAFFSTTACIGLLLIACLPDRS